MPDNQSVKTEQDREFRELDSSISSNLSEREGKKERKRRKKQERENGNIVCVFCGSSRVRKT